MTQYPQTGDLWAYRPETSGFTFLIMEHIKMSRPGYTRYYKILRLEDGQVSDYAFTQSSMRLWKKVA